MPSAHESFWEAERYAVIGHSEVARFPRITYEALKAKGKTVYPVDPTAKQIDGDDAYPDLASLPEAVEAVVVEVPPPETAGWIEQAAAAGVHHAWIHMGRDTPEARAAAEAHDVALCTGTCAVQYLRGGFPHNVHKVLRKMTGNW